MLSVPTLRACDLEVAKTILVCQGEVGCASTSSVRLELVAKGRAPAARVLGAVDPILALGVVVAREMAFGSRPVLLLPPDRQARFPDGLRVRIAADGRIFSAPERR